VGGLCINKNAEHPGARRFCLCVSTAIHFWITNLQQFLLPDSRPNSFVVHNFTSETFFESDERNHLPPSREVPKEIETLTMDQIEVKSYVGELVRSFERKAA
jgi:hypothetical protein